jgi:hypothetical protein
VTSTSPTFSARKPRRQKTKTGTSLRPFPSC